MKFNENHQFCHEISGNQQFIMKYQEFVKTVTTLLFGPRELTKSSGFVCSLYSDLVQNHQMQCFSVFQSSHNQVTIVKTVIIRVFINNLVKTVSKPAV